MSINASRVLGERYVILLLEIAQLVVKEDVLIQLALVHVPAGFTSAESTLLLTLILQCAFLLSMPALFSINALASLPSEREKSNPPIYVPVLFQVSLVI